MVMTMFEKISIRWRLTILSALLLTFCCIGLTVVLNFTAYRLVDNIDLTMISTPVITNVPTKDYVASEGGQETSPSPSTESVHTAKKGFRIESVIYMLIAILGGSTLTYYISGKALKPLDILNGQVKNLTVHNLSDTLAIPPTNDEIAELTTSFNEMTDKLNQAFLMQKRFSVSAAHELRTPLAVLQTKVDVFKKKNPHTIEEYESLISVLEKQIRRLRGLIGNLMDMTNIDDERELSNLELRDIFEDIIAELASIAEDKQIELFLESDDTAIVGNVELLYRAFYNLVENAIKYNVANGTVKIEVKQIANEQVEIQIRDSGIGIPNEMKKHIFDPFYRVDKSRSRAMGGAGLGLSIVDSIIQKHNGNITVIDNVESGSGTCFKIVLPETVHQECIRKKALN